MTLEYTTRAIKVGWLPYNLQKTYPKWDKNFEKYKPFHKYPHVHI